MIAVPVELGLAKRKYRKGLVRVTVAYPSTYKVAMLSLSFHMLYNAFVRRGEFYVERATLDSRGRSLETGTPLKSFDVIVFSVHYELDYVNLVRMLLDGGVELFSARRRRPLIIIGGPPVIANPEPLADIADVIIIGELEAVIDALMSKILELGDDVERYADVDGFYVPSLGRYEVRYSYLEGVDEVDLTTRIVKVEDLKMPFEGAYPVEICRGCPFNCLFCMEGFTTKPFRRRSLRSICRAMDRAKDLGFKKLMLVALSANAHAEFNSILREALDRGFSISAPSLRAELLDEEGVELIARGGQKVLTVAPETSERLRLFLGKGVPDGKFIEVAEEAGKYGMHVKLYLMVGLPGETKQDLNEIVKLVEGLRSKNKDLYISVNPFVPKPATPLQWTGISDVGILELKIKYIEDRIGKAVRVSTYKPIDAVIQAYIGLNDRSIGKVLVECAMSSRKRSAWRRILEKAPRWLHEGRDPSAELPWDHVKRHVPREVLEKLRDKFFESALGRP